MRKVRLLFILCALIATTMNLQAQSWRDLLKGNNITETITDVVNTVTGTNKADITGTWVYQGSSIEFKTDNLLEKAGGSVAASTLESKIDKQLSKVGIKQGITSFTFNADSTFNSTVNGKKLDGTYVYDASAGTIELTYSALVTISAQINASSSTLALLFNADKLLQLLTTYGSKSTNTTVQTIVALAGSYEGMSVGLEMKKK
ncbi:DUF4923 family protein [Bacteroides sp. 214]|uniref:DUF4923 family protein n=1 Tax=Bacteroides sp. 214 TaxID=2302935 RepID=UPI0013D52826|nr:DUF4923 family protein [Bacteroides sp. 214]NDW11290.1 DUF4923 family protein [Bacteroides sp. 214]